MAGEAEFGVFTGREEGRVLDQLFFPATLGVLPTRPVAGFATLRVGGVGLKQDFTVDRSVKSLGRVFMAGNTDCAPNKAFLFCRWRLSFCRRDQKAYQSLKLFGGEIEDGHH